MSKWEIGIPIPIYNRYYITSASFNSLMNCYGLTNVKVVIIDDCSPDPKVTPMLEGFKQGMEERGNKVEIYRHKKRWGKFALGQNFKQAMSHLHDTKYILFTPDDAIYNPYLIDVVKKCYQYFKDRSVKAITFFKDSRGTVWKGFEKKGIYNQFFEIHGCTDGFLTLFETNSIKKFNWNKIKPTESSTRVWYTISSFLSVNKILLYDESLAIHLGNVKSAMLGGVTRSEKKYICAEDLNLWTKPKILQVDV